MKKTDLAYFAGILDGEGYIGINPRRQRGYSCPSLEVVITNTKFWLLEQLKFSFGGYVSIGKKVKPNWNIRGSWIVSHRVALTFLELVYPYLKLKKQEAEIAIAFQKTKRHGGRRKDERERAVEEAQRILLKQLKGRI